MASTPGTSGKSNMIILHRAAKWLQTNSHGQEDSLSTLTLQGLLSVFLCVLRASHEDSWLQPVLLRGFLVQFVFS